MARYATSEPTITCCHCTLRFAYREGIPVKYKMPELDAIRCPRCKTAMIETEGITNGWPGTSPNYEKVVSYLTRRTEHLIG